MPYICFRQYFGRKCHPELKDTVSNKTFLFGLSSHKIQSIPRGYTLNFRLKALQASLEFKFRINSVMILRDFA